MDKIERSVFASEYNETKLNSLLVLTETGGTLLADGTEQNLYINNAPAGVYKPLVVYVNLDNMATADSDVMEIKVYQRITSAGNLELLDYQEFIGDDGGLTDSKKLIAIELLPSRFGCKVTLEQTAGVNKNYDYEVIIET